MFRYTHETAHSTVSFKQRLITKLKQDTSRLCARAYQYFNLHDVHMQHLSVCKHHVCVLYMCKLNDLVYTGKKRYFDILPIIHFVCLIMNLTKNNKHFKIMDD